MKQLFAAGTPLAGLAQICQTPRPNFSSASRHAVFNRWVHSNRRSLWVAVVATLFAASGGCAFFNLENWNPSNYRDEQAVDINQRLDRSEPIVKSPF